MRGTYNKDKAVVDFFKREKKAKEENSLSFRCPICGGKAYWHSNNNFGTYAQCTRCGAESK